MHYRKLGRTGLVVSEIAMGCEGFFEEDCTMAKSSLMKPKKRESIISIFMLRILR